VSGKVLKSRKKCGLTPVISTIILSAVVIAVGGAVWSYSQGAATVIANDYVNGTMTLLNEVIERYAVEHVSNSSNGNILRIWIYNYGDVDVTLDTYVNVTGGGFNSTLGTYVASEDLEEIQVFLTTTLERSDEVAIKVHSRRQNNAYYKHIVP